MKRLTSWLALAAFSLVPVQAEEGMWTFNNFPVQKVQQQYGFKPSQSWLDNLRLSSVRLAGGCSASFVSPEGLVITNHHCMSTCIQQLSTPDQDYMKQGFYAKTLADEIKCTDVELNVLVNISDVTARVTKATQGLSDQKFNDAQKAEFSKIEKACAENDRFRCDVVSLYQGGIYHKNHRSS
ncbi:S46 family peptidase [Candidatus Cyanaurora vandensis]|uniref:S46 family peptidase n=1 Tax=Candidatus Cyanaurora vandensis TaxID=2714958 RepID=UPI00257AE099|nr:S46 family peptidase [Candidatus Cyanaurora vandensis]